MAEAAMAHQKDNQPALTRLIEKAWRDPVFKQRLIADPAAAFAEAGLPVPKGKTIRVLEETSGVDYFILPPPPGGGGGLSDAELNAVAGGVPHSVIKTAIARFALFTCK
jgi:hypothetical protein